MRVTTRTILFIVLFYALIAVIITWPAVTQLTTHGIGAGYGDQWEHIYTIWWVKYAIQTGQNPIYHSLLGYPDGFFSPTLWSEPFTFWPAVPFAFLVGELTAFNLLVLIMLTLNGVTAFVLCWWVGGRKGLITPLIGGVVFAAFPAVQGHISAGHSGVLTLYGFPLFVLCLWRIVREGAGYRTALLGALAFWLTAVANGVQMVFTLFPMTLFFLGYHVLWARDRVLRWTVIRQLALVYMLGIVLCLPFFGPLAIELTRPSRSADLTEGGWVTYSADPFAFISPSPFTPWGAGLAPGYARAVLGTNSTEGAAYLGLIVIGVCLFGLALARRRDAPTMSPVISRKAIMPWLFVMGGSMLFSLGPALKLFDQPIFISMGVPGQGGLQTYITLPYLLIQILPIFSSSRTPGRFNLTTGLALAVITSLALGVILSRIGMRRVIRVALSGALLAGILVDYQLFFPTLTSPAAIPSYFYDLAKDTSVRAVFDVPWDNRLAAKDAIYLQTAHHKPMIAGHVVRRTPVDPAKLNLIEAVIVGRIDDRQLETDAMKAFLVSQGIDRIILHKNYLKAEQIDVVEKRFGTPLFVDPNMSVYGVNQTTARIPPALGVLDTTTGATYFFTYSDTVLSVSGADPDKRALLVQLNGQNLGTAECCVMFRLPTGFYTFTANGRASIAPQMYAVLLPIKAEFGALLTLDSVGLYQDFGTGINISINIRPLRDLSLAESSDMRYFIHVIDPQGKLAVQFDGKLPPDFGVWRKGQLFTATGEVRLPEPGVKYKIYIGWYRLSDLKRLPVSGTAAPMNADMILVGEF